MNKKMTNLKPTSDWGKYEPEWNWKPKPNEKIKEVKNNKIGWRLK